MNISCWMLPSLHILKPLKMLAWAISAVYIVNFLGSWPSQVCFDHDLGSLRCWSPPPPPSAPHQKAGGPAASQDQPCPVMKNYQTANVAAVGNMKNLRNWFDTSFLPLPQKKICLRVESESEKFRVFSFHHFNLSNQAIPSLYPPHQLSQLSKLKCLTSLIAQSFILPLSGW